MTRAATGHRWLLVLALLASALAIGAASPQSSFAAADLQLTVTDTPDPAVPGDIVTISATVQNVGNETAVDPTVTFSPPSTEEATVQTFGGCFNAILISCAIGTTPPGGDQDRLFAPGATARLSITLRVLKAGTVSVGVNVNHAGIATDPPPNAFTAVTTVEPQADLMLELAAVSPVTMGNVSIVTATITNSLPGSAREAKLQVVIPPELPVSAVPQGCTATALKVVCDLGTITDQEKVTRAITLSIPSEGSFILLGSVSWSRPDPTPVDGQSQVTITGLSPVEPTDGGPPPTPAEKPVLPRPQAVPISLITSGVASGRRCIRGRTLRFKLRRPSGVALTQADIYVGKRRVKRLTGAALTKRVVLRGLPKGRYTVIVVASLRDGGRLSGRRVLKACR